MRNCTPTTQCLVHLNEVNAQWSHAVRRLGFVACGVSGHNAHTSAVEAPRPIHLITILLELLEVVLELLEVVLELQNHLI